MTSDGTKKRLRVEIAYALRDRQSLIAVEMEDGGTVEEAIRRSGMLAEFPEIDLECAKLGIFGKRVLLGALVRDGDRVEIYRPLIADPKLARRTRAKQPTRAERRR